MRILSVTPECYPLVKTGGLADVTGALPGALAAEGIAVETLLPGYPAVMAALRNGAAFWSGDLMGGPARLMRGQAAGLDLIVLDAPHLYDRPGNLYLGPDGHDWPDNALRFAALARVAADLAQGKAGPAPDIVHAHDWQAALVPAYLHYDGMAAPPVVLTVHNLAFQGRFPAYMLGPLGLPAAAYALDGLEYYGDIGFLKGGLLFADRITTVSPTYAQEIAGTADGMGLDGLLRGRGAALGGILNGIDTAVWNPADDPRITAPFDAADPAPRRDNRQALRAHFGLADSERPLFAVVSRLTGQKGMDLLLAALPRLLAEGGDLALLGAGEPTLEAGFIAAAAANPGRIGCTIGYDENLAHLLQAGADALLVPSRFEPCGLTQLCALRYGSVPVVARVGGLADTVIDANEAALAAGVATGIVFAGGSQAALDQAITRAIALHADRTTWARIQRNGMAQDVSWAAPARRYADLFRELARPT